MVARLAELYAQREEIEAEMSDLKSELRGPGTCSRRRSSAVARRRPDGTSSCWPGMVVMRVDGADGRFRDLIVNAQTDASADEIIRAARFQARAARKGAYR
ncbi:hypothetical protein GIY23_08365 [Allosaccharopolyspora coralli]|uniref:Uncharacterized protein n=1 Tax=Allosaccharopolyspora coralli TaxID=2665642 RepID=A0A5Q3Q7X1_9PSEU|nr:hypothetical protein [Allosaccharopolyspora coralli]QGK69536.1 hypothetical protein GIY23_08365 [Allosaccharopolyspora coralli]